MGSWHRPIWNWVVHTKLMAMQAPDSGPSLPQPLGPNCIPSPVICHMRGLHLECKRPGGAAWYHVQMAIRGLTLSVLDDSTMWAFLSFTAMLHVHSFIRGMHYGMSQVIEGLAASLLPAAFSESAERSVHPGCHMF